MANENENHESGHHEKPNPSKTFEIKIDRATYKVSQERMTGQELRALAQPAIGPNLDLYEVVPGGSDRKIELTTVVEIKNGLRFFTAPAQINPGK